MDRQVAQAFFGRFRDLNDLQRASADALLAGHNLVLSAGTGSGKTEAAVAPLVSRHLQGGRFQRVPFLLFVCPTKALIGDLTRRLSPPFEQLGLRLALRHGDRDQLGQAPVHALLTTPESLGILLMRGGGWLSGVKAMIIDEVHLLTNTQRGLQLAISRHQLECLRGEPVQWAALSATIARPADVSGSLFGPCTPCVHVEFPTTRQLDAHILALEDTRSAEETLSRVMQHPTRKLLLFTNTRRDCEQLAERMRQHRSIGDCAMVHHSSMAPGPREQTEREFTGAARAVCVATSTLEFGIDIGDIDAVALWGVPHSMESFLQRIGRGNRRGEKTNAICFAPPGPSSVRDALVFAALIRLARAGRMPLSLPRPLYGALGQQALCYLLSRNGAYTSVIELTDRLAALPHLDRSAIEEVLEGLAAHRLVQHHPYKNQYGATQELWDVYDTGVLFGNFPIGLQTVDVLCLGRLVGSIPRLNLVRVRPGSCIRLGGRVWHVRSARAEGLVVERAAGPVPATVPIVYGTRAAQGLSTFLGTALWATLFDERSAYADMAHPTAKKVARAVDPIRRACSSSSLPFYRTPTRFVYLTFGGAALNQLVSHFYGQGACEVSDLTIASPLPLPFDRLPDSAGELLGLADNSPPPDPQQTFFQRCLPLELQQREFNGAWLADEDVSCVLERLRGSQPVEVNGDIFAPLQPLP